MLKKRRLSRSHNIMLGFIIVILVGACLLSLPIATKEGESTTFLNALFTSVSATCVTGLVAYDTFTHWTLFGQLVILLEIQIGGLGLITIGTFMMILMRQKIGLERRTLIQESLNTLQIRGSIRLVRRIIIATLIVEGLGAIILSTQFVRDFGLLRGIYFGIFHSISAFCNAGFDLLGIIEPFSSFTSYYNNSVVIVTLCFLIVIGGLGFVVWDDLFENTYHFKKYRLQTKIVLTVTAFLLVAGTGLFMLYEHNHLFVDMPIKDQILAALFSSVTPRTAGFNSIDTASLSNGSLFLTVILMFIGGSPGSTAGGIKTVTIAVILLELKAYVRHEKECVIFKHSIEEDMVEKAMTVVSINLLFALGGILCIFASQTLPLRDVLFEVFSAIGTAGMSTGVTRSLTNFSRIVIMILMFSGRMGSLTIAMSFTERQKTGEIRYPKESITVG